MSIKIVWVNQNLLMMSHRTGRLLLCQGCPCECKPEIIDTYLLHPNGSWDLRKWQGEKKVLGSPFDRKWRLQECTGGVGYYENELTRDGTLVGMPSEFGARYGYDGYMTLQIGCVDPITGELSWPDCDYRP